jgi:hypothetical protein
LFLLAPADVDPDPLRFNPQLLKNNHRAATKFVTSVVTFSVVSGAELAVLSRNPHPKPEPQKIFLEKSGDRQEMLREPGTCRALVRLTFLTSWILFIATFDKLAGNAGCGFYNYTLDWCWHK